MLTFNTIKFKVKLTCLLINQIKILGARRKYMKEHDERASCSKKEEKNKEKFEEIRNQSNVIVI